MFVGAGAALAGLRLERFIILIAMSASFVAGGSLYAALPEDRWEGVIIEASIRGCSDPATLAAGAIATWEKVHAQPGNTPRPGWKEDVPGMLDRDKGVVLTMFVYRKRDVFSRQRPWNRGVLRATEWQETGSMESFFDRRAAGSCSSYPLGQAAFYSTEWESGDESPSNVISSFLGLSVLREVPANFQAFVHGEKPVSRSVGWARDWL